MFTGHIIVALAVMGAGSLGATAIATRIDPAPQDRIAEAARVFEETRSPVVTLDLDSAAQCEAVVRHQAGWSSEGIKLLQASAAHNCEDERAAVVFRFTTG